MENFITEEWSLTQATANVTEADGTADTWSDIWKWQVPSGNGIVIDPGDSFAAYLEDASAEIANNARVRIQVRESEEDEAKTIIPAVPYVRVKSFDDERKRFVYEGATVRIDENWWIVVQVNDDGAIDASDSYFELTGKRARPRLRL